MNLAKSLCALSLLAAGATQAFTLTLEVTDANSTKGTVNVGLYDSENSWLNSWKAVQLLKVPSAGGKTVLVIPNLAPGRYAITAFHDENSNRRFDIDLLGPIERYGISRDARLPMLPPSFADAAVELQEDTTLRITLR